MEAKCVPLLFLGSLLGTRRSAIGHFFPIPGNSPRSLCESGDLDNSEFHQRRFRATHVNRKWSFFHSSAAILNKFLDVSSL